MLTLDLDNFRAVQGSNDEALLKRVLTKRRTEIKLHDDFFSSPAFPSYEPLATAIEHIVRGSVEKRGRARLQYEHAAVMIAKTMGKPVDGEVVREAAPDFYVPVDQVIRKRLRQARLPASSWPGLGKVMKRGPLLDVPRDPKWPLGTGYLTADEVESAVAAAKQLDLQDSTGLEGVDFSDEALQIAAAYRTWLAKAARQGVGLFFHF